MKRLGESWVSAWMALAGTLLVAGLAQAQTPQVSAQEVIMKLQSAMSKEHSLIDNREKLKAAYKADSKSPETQELKREFCSDWLADNTELAAAFNAREAYMRHPPFVPEDEQKIWHLGKQTDGLVSESWQLGTDLFAMGVTCPGVNTAERPAKPSAKNPIEGQTILVVVFVVGLVLYFLPSLVAAHKKKRNANAICALNFLLGWTVLGWIISLVWASCEDPPPVVAAPSEPTMHAGRGLFCSHCGAQAPVGSKFCPQCGK